MNAFYLRCIIVAAIVAAFSASAGASAPVGRYTINNGTVFDSKTKLTWQRTTTPSTYSWGDAKVYCASVGTSLGGTGWRLPTVKELLTIVDYSQSTPPLIDPTAFPATPVVFFWSSTPLAGSPLDAWGVYLQDGYTVTNDVSGPYVVRCVR